VGRVIERFALTELPQLLLVLKNEMSLVGNRPLPENVIDSLKEHYPKVNARFDTPAGLTGPAQLVGREKITDSERLEIEITYCQIASRHYSSLLDFKILLYTVLISLRVIPAMTVNEVKWLMLHDVNADVVESVNNSLGSFES
jgi:lipopolysaccharide/colanic/teichoic acid biosynthesis glycosyltransferase